MPKVKKGGSTLALLLSLAWCANAQTTINGGRAISGGWDASSAATTKPAKAGTTLPAACGVGEQYFKTDAAPGQNLYLCASPNTWAQLTGGGEVNTASNVGAGGVGTFDAKTGVNLGFRNIAAGSSKISVTLDAVNKLVNIDTVEGNLDLNNLSGALGVTKGGTGATSAAGALANFGAAGVSVSNTYAAGTKQTFQPSAATSGLNLLCATLPSSPAANDVACDSGDGNKWKLYNGSSWIAIGNAVSSVFSRTGAVAAQTGDYTTAQVIESGNLYFTNARAQSAMNGLYEFPLTFNAPLSRSANTISCLTASISQAGCLSSADWATFNGKQAAISGAPATWPSFATVATSGSYNDLSNKPTSLPPNGSASGDLSGSYPGPTVVQVNGAAIPTSGMLKANSSHQIVQAAAGTDYMGTATAVQASQMPALTGDCTTSAGAVATTCTKTNGVVFAASATTDTTNASNISSGTLASARLPATISANTTGNAATATALAAAPTQCSAGNYPLGIAANGNAQSCTPAAGSGTVTSVSVTVPAWAAVTVTNPTTTPAIAITAATGQTANQVLATPNGSAGAVGLRALVAGDLPAAIPLSQTNVLDRTFYYFKEDFDSTVSPSGWGYAKIGTDNGGVQGLGSTIDTAHPGVERVYGSATTAGDGEYLQKLQGNGSGGLPNLGASGDAFSCTIIFRPSNGVTNIITRAGLAGTAVLAPPEFIGVRFDTTTASPDTYWQLETKTGGSTSANPGNVNITPTNNDWMRLDFNGTGNGTINFTLTDTTASKVSTYSTSTNVSTSNLYPFAVVASVNSAGLRQIDVDFFGCAVTGLSR